MIDIICDEILKALAHLPKSFDKNNGELAYLALTSKPELPIRDRLAFELQKKLRGRGISIAREWYLKRNRIDIAILNEHNRKPKVLIQLKTWSLFTFIKRSKDHFDSIKKDLRKCGRDVSYCLLLATLPWHPQAIINNENLDKVVKYWKGMGKAFGKETSKDVKIKAEQKIIQHLSEG